MLHDVPRVTNAANGRSRMYGLGSWIAGPKTAILETTESTLCGTHEWGISGVAMGRIVVILAVNLSVPNHMQRRAWLGADRQIWGPKHPPKHPILTMGAVLDGGVSYPESRCFGTLFWTTT